MGVGYVVGCLASIILWKLDRRKIIGIFNENLKKIIKNSILLEIVYLLITVVSIGFFSIYNNNEILNTLTAFLVIDISNTERKNLCIKDRTHFYDSISTISKALVGGFVAPLFYILLFGNGFGVAYMILYNISIINRYNFIKFLFNILTIVPSAIAQVLLYCVYLVRNRKLSIDFKGDYLINSITRPLLNIDILGAYIESVNFYCYFYSKDVHYVKSYGEYTNKIDIICVKDYLSITYGIAMTYFIVFYILQRLV